MKLRNALLVALVAIVALFAVANWSVIGTPVHVRYLFGSGDLPLGVILLALFIAMVIFHVVAMWYREASNAMDKWLTARELNEAMERAKASEDDRIGRLAKSIDLQHRELGDKLDELLARIAAVKLEKVIERESAGVAGRMRKVEKRLRKDLRRSGRRFRRR